MTLRDDRHISLRVAPISVSIPVVAFGDRRWTLADGESLSFGRRSNCDLIVGGAESLGGEDLGVSRRAGTLSHAQGRMWIRNDSASQPLYVHSPIRGEQALEARGDMVSLAESHLEVVLKGRALTYRISVDLPNPAAGELVDGPATESPPTAAALPVSDRERLLLTALCEPLLTRAGTEARPASYREAATRIGLSEHSVRNGLDALRRRLFALGIPGMEGPEAKNNLARYAVRSHTIGAAELKLLDAGDRDGE